MTPQARTDHPELLAITAALSRHAKRADLTFADRAALYDLKRQCIKALCRREELAASSTSAAPWAFGAAFDAAFPHLSDLTRTAAEAGRALTGAQLRRAGLTCGDLPLRPRSPGTFSGLSVTQRLQLHPRGGWLVGFAPDGQGRAWLHLPYPLVDWLTPPVAAKVRQPIGDYGTPASADEDGRWSLLHAVNGLGLTPRDFPHGLRPQRWRDGHRNAPVVHRH